MRSVRSSCDVVIISNSVGPSRGGAPRQVMLLANALHAEGRRVVVVTKQCEETQTGLPAGIEHLMWREGTGGYRVVRRLRDLRRLPTGPARTLVLGTEVLSRLARISTIRHGSLMDLFRVGLMVILGRVAAGEDAGHVRRLLRALDTPVVIAFMPNVAALVALAGLRPRTRFVSSVRGDPSQQVLARPWGDLQYLVGRRSSLVTANSVGALEYLRHLPGYEGCSFRVSPNLLADFPMDAAPDRHRFIVVGSLHPGKRVDLALRALAAARPALDDWELLIVGDGPARGDLEGLSVGLGMSGRVRFLGHVENTGAVLAEGGVLLQLSDAEGMPNAVMEAMAHGLAVAVSDGSPGPVELAVGAHGRAGLVVPVGDVEATREMLLTLAGDRELRRSLGRTGREAAARMLWEHRADDWHRILGDR